MCQVLSSQQLLTVVGEQLVARLIERVAERQLLAHVEVFAGTGPAIGSLADILGEGALGIVETGDPPEVRTYGSFEDEVKGIVDWIGDGDPSRTCLVARTNGLRDQYDAALNEAGIETRAVHRSKPDDPSSRGSEWRRCTG